MHLIHSFASAAFLLLTVVVASPAPAVAAVKGDVAARYLRDEVSESGIQFTRPFLVSSC